MSAHDNHLPSLIGIVCRTGALADEPACSLDRRHDLWPLVTWTIELSARQNDRRHRAQWVVCCHGDIGRCLLLSRNAEMKNAEHTRRHVVFVTSSRTVLTTKAALKIIMQHWTIRQTLPTFNCSASRTLIHEASRLNRREFHRTIVPSAFYFKRETQLECYIKQQHFLSVLTSKRRHHSFCPNNVELYVKIMYVYSNAFQVYRRHHYWGIHLHAAIQRKLQLHGGVLMPAVGLDELNRITWTNKNAALDPHLRCGPTKTSSRVSIFPFGSIIRSVLPTRVPTLGAVRMRIRL